MPGSPRCASRETGAKPTHRLMQVMTVYRWCEQQLCGVPCVVHRGGVWGGAPTHSSCSLGSPA
eukprot:7972829-Pyramimonas_sp.AAC.1